MRLNLSRRDLGPLTIAGLVVAQVVLWNVARPAGQSTGSYLGQLFGAESILLLSIALVLISTLTRIEQWFDGIDRAAIWHRRVAITGLVLLVPHMLLSSNPDSSAVGDALAVIGASGLAALALWAILPRWQSIAPKPVRSLLVGLRDRRVVQEVRRLVGGYGRWRAIHRTTGLFVAAGFVHGLLDETVFAGSGVLRWTYVAIGGIGLAFYVYRELLARYVVAHHDYQVHAVRTIADGLVEIAMRPLGTGVKFVAGQFAMIYIEAKDGWHRHPFTISSAPSERIVRITVKALGDYTSRLHEIVEPGMPAIIGAPHGRFDRRRGTDRQVWIAGGVGVTPFLSWIRSLDGDLTERVDFFYTTVGEAPFSQEIHEIAARHESLHAHLIDTAVDGRLSSEQILAAAGDADGLSVFMCGPEGMLRAFQTGLEAAGVPSRQIHREYFDWR